MQRAELPPAGLKSADHLKDKEAEATVGHTRKDGDVGNKICDVMTTTTTYHC